MLAPLSLESFASGVVKSPGTTWGLFRHYWGIVKLSISGVATVFLLLYVPTLQVLGDAVTSPRSPDAAAVSAVSPVLDSRAAVVLLLLAAYLELRRVRADGAGCRG